MVDGEPSLAAPVAGVPYLVSEAVGTILPTFRWFDPPAVLAGQAYAHALAHDQSGGVGGAFLRSVPGTTGTVTVTARHPASGKRRWPCESARLTRAPRRRRSRRRSHG